MASPMSTSSNDDTEVFWRFSWHHGRKFNTNTRDETFILPTDNDEWSRQDTQHYMLKFAINANYGAASVVKKLLHKDQGPAPRVLDLGCGTGTWAIEMAEEFKYAEVTGIDLAPPFIAVGRPIPPNCRFEVDDVNLSLDHYTGFYDVIHGRIIDPSVKDYPRFLDSVAKMLKPDGLLLLVKPELRLYDEYHRLLPVYDEGHPEFCALQRISVAAHDAVIGQGNINEDAVLHWTEMILANPNFERESFVLKTIHIPVCGWPDETKGMSRLDYKICDMMRDNLIQVTSSWKPLLMNAGHDEAQVDRWSEKAKEELMTLTVHAMMRYSFCWVQRRHGPHILSPASSPTPHG